MTGRGAAADVQHPSEEDTQSVMTMFPDHPRETIMRAFAAAHNNPNRAVEIMLSTPSPSGASRSEGGSSSRTL